MAAAREQFAGHHILPAIGIVAADAVIADTGFQTNIGDRLTDHRAFSTQLLGTRAVERGSSAKVAAASR
jgi:hypothetical protein